MNNGILPVERTLGMQWCMQSDTFNFKVTLNGKPLTRRGILSMVSSIFDPLGLIAPFVLLGKQLLQELRRHNVDWDEAIPEDIICRFNIWKEELPLLQNVKIPRCYKYDNFDRIHYVELHHFSDACETGYGQCSYLKMTNCDGQVLCTLIMAKSRVTPIKPVTMPRLELTAALVSVRVSKFLKKRVEF